MDELIKKMWWVYAMAYSSAFTKKKILSYEYVSTWMKLEDIMLREIS